MHYHASRHSIDDQGQHTDARDLGTFPRREGAACAVLQSVGARLAESGWIVDACNLPTGDGLGVVEIHNLLSDLRLGYLAWGCQCSEGERDVKGLAVA